MCSFLLDFGTTAYMTSEKMDMFILFESSSVMSPVVRRPFQFGDLVCKSGFTNIIVDRIWNLCCQEGFAELACVSDPVKIPQKYGVGVENDNNNTHNFL